MPPIDSDSRWTTERFLAWTAPEDGNRYELLDGELLVTPAPTLRHQAVLRELFLAVHHYVATNDLGECFFAPLDVIVADDTVLEPDLLVMAHRTTRSRHELVTIDELCLAVEVLSPSSRTNDLRRKRLRLQRAGLAAYWVVDPDARTLLTWDTTSEVATVHHATVTWRLHDAAPPHTLDLAALFTRALDR
ncbi:MAG: Uma2 family endonuclease [Gemmatimonadaceae bacterium]|nr:Uma2 family endonuclease [Gemmatimonadaceae bacterium]